MKKSQYGSVMRNILAREICAWVFVVCVLVSIPLSSVLGQDATNCVTSLADEAIATGPSTEWQNPEGFEDAEAADRWVADFGIWEVGRPTYGPPTNSLGQRAYGGTNCLATMLNGNYTDDRSSRVMSPSFVVPASDQNPRLRFWHWWSFSCDDSGQVQISTNNGATWTALSPGYAADSSGKWTRPSLDLRAYAGRAVRIGFYFYSHNADYGGCCGPCYDGNPDVDAGWYVDEIMVVTGAPPVIPNPDGFEDAEAADRWVADFGIWEVGRPTYGPPTNSLGQRAYGGTNCLATMLNGNYTDDRSSRVMSPSFVVPASDQNPRLRFWHWWSFSCDDSGQVQISTNNGATWTALSPGYAADSSGKWTRPSLDLRAYAGRAVRIGFYFYSHNADYGGCCGPCYDGNPDVDAGWYVDEIMVVTGAPPVIPNPDGFEDAEAADRWVADFGIWEVGRPTYGPPTNSLGQRAYGGTNCLATMLNGNYTDDRSSRVMSPSFVVPASDQNPRLRFWHWWSFSCDDSGQVQISTNNGATWTALSPGYAADSSGKWTRPSLDLRAYAGRAVRIGFYFYSHNADYGGCCGPCYDGNPDVDAGWYVDEIMVVTGAPPVIPNPDGFEDAEAADRWVADFGIWEVGRPTYGPPTNSLGQRAYGGTNCLATMLNGNYTDDRSSRVMSPSFVVPASDQNPRLRFWHWWSFSCDDSGQVQISTNNGATWTALSPGYAADSSGKWTRPSLDLRAYAGRAVRIGFYFYSHNADYGGCCGPCYDGNPDVDAGWYVDEIMVVTGAPPVIPNPDGFEDAEAADRWVADFGIWEVGRPTYGPPTNSLGQRAYGGTNCLATMLNGNYTDDRSSRVMSPSFVVPASDQNPRLRFWHWWSFSCDDSGQVQISTNNGATWTALSPGYAADSSGKWTRPSLDLRAYAGRAVRIGFYFYSHNADYGGCCGPCYDGNPDVDAGWYVDEIMVVTGAPPVIPNPDGFEDAEAADRWVADFGIWEVGRPTYGPPTNSLGQRAYGGTNCLATMLNGNYTDDRSSRVMSPSFVVPASDQNPRLRFWHWWSFSCDDSGQVQISTNNGATWTALSPGYAADSSGKWTRPSLDLRAYAGRAVRIGFYFYSHNADYGGCCGPCYDGNPDVDAGWYVDEIMVVTGAPPVIPNPDGFEDAEAADRWVADFGIWEVGRPTYGPPTNSLGQRAYGGTNCLATMLNGNYTDDRSSRVMSPSFVVPCAGANPSLRFRHWWSFSCDDWGQVQISTNDGASWINLSPQYCSTSSGDWTRPSLDLRAYAGQVVRIGFYFYSHNADYSGCCGPCYDGNPDVDAGWYVDDVFIQCDALQLPSLPSWVNEDVLWTFTCTSVCTDLVFGLKFGAPTGAAIDPETGIFTWTPDEREGPDVYSITVLVTNRLNSLMPVDSATFSIPVNEVNQAPELVSNRAINRR